MVLDKNVSFQTGYIEKIFALLYKTYRCLLNRKKRRENNSNLINVWY